MCLCKIIGHNWNVEVISENIKVSICKRCKYKKHEKQYIGSRLVTIYNRDYEFIKEDLIR